MTTRRARTVLAREGFEVAATTPELAAASVAGTVSAAVIACAPSALDADVRRLRELLPSAPVVAVCSADDRRAVRTALAAGADAYVREAEIEETLAAAVRAATAGLACVPRGARDVFGRPAFSHREKQVLQLVARGFTNSEIAARLFLAESTVKSHLSSSFRKLGVRTRREAAALVLDPERGLEFRTLD
ncbi:MAG: response regulator transcription factor [Thermoleophilaceae bacterium]